MSSDPSIEDHVAFKKLLDLKDPAAIEVHAAFSATRNHAAFNAGLIKVVRGSSSDVKPQKSKPAPAIKQSTAPQQQTQQIPAATSAPKPAAVSKNICRHMRTTGACRNGSSCKFSHDIAGQTGEATAAVEPKVGKVPLNKAEKTNIKKNEKQSLHPPNTPPRGSARPAESTPERSIGEPSTNTPPRSPAEKAAATSRFLGLFGVRSSAAHPSTEAAPLMPPTAIPGHAAAPSTTEPAETLAPASNAFNSVDGKKDQQSTPHRVESREKGLEDLLFDSPPSSKQFWTDVHNSAPPSASGSGSSWPAQDRPHEANELDLNLSLDLGKLNFDNNSNISSSTGPAGPTEPFRLNAPTPPGFGNPPFPFPFGAENGNPFPHGQGPPHHPGLPAMPPVPPHFFMQPPAGFPPHMFPHMPPMPGMPPMPPMGQFGAYGPPPNLGGFGPPPHLMHQQPHQQPQFGQHGQTYQTMTCAPVRSTLSDFPAPAPTPSTSHLSVHDMLGQSDGAPLSPASDERAQRLLSLLQGGGAPPASAQGVAAEPGTSTNSESSPFSKSLNGPASSAVGGQQQKSRALLSLLKSSKTGPSLSLSGNVAPPTPTSTGSTAAAFPVPASPSNSTPTKGPSPLPPFTPVAAPAFTTPVKGKNRSQSITSDVGEDGEPIPLGTATPATPAKKASFFRNTKFQCGTMQIAVNGVVRPNHIMAPSTNMAVQWQMSQEEFHTLMNKSSTALVIGLVRYGSYTNSPCFVSKQIERRPKLGRDQEGHPVYMGTVVFHAPKSAGQFVYRMFDESSKDSALTTLATSPMFSVDLADFYVNTNLRHILEALSEKSKVKGISQMPAVIRGIRNGGRNDRASGNAEQMMTECFHTVLRAVMDSIPVIETWKDRKRAIALEEKETGKESALATGKEAEEAKASYKQAMRVHGESFAAISSVLECRAPYSLLSDSMKAAVGRQQSLFCPHLQRYFRDPEHMREARVEEIGFNVALDQNPAALALAAGADYCSVVARVNASIDQLLPTLLPREDFQQTRETAVAQLQLALLTENAVPPGTEVALYGSSNNSFGSDGADMDMTLLFPPSIHITADDKPIVIERLGNVLTRIGMSSVATRATARIPIVTFKDPLNMFDCDISLQNQLAVANTKLLRTYGSIDPRVRILVFLIKHWAKSRHLNSPGDGTLSSYGFILCLIHFLQNRPVPLVPNLQSLPPVWNGQRRPVPQLHVDALNDLLPTAPPANRAAALQHKQQVQRDQEQAEALSQFERQSIPKVIMHSADNIRCNAYFYAPALAQPHLLPNFARENQESVAELLVEFFRYFAWNFDFRQKVVSIRQSGHLSKLDKAEQHGWLQSDILSIEDPFEAHYDVAHVIKSAQMVYFRKELLRAYTLASRVLSPNPFPDSLPASVAPEAFLSLLCEPAEAPPFTAVARERLASSDVIP